MPPKGRKKPKKNKGKINPTKVLIRSIKLELKHRTRDIENLIVRTRVQPAIDNAPWIDEKIDKSDLNCIITKKYKYKEGIWVETESKLRSQPIRLIDAQEADFAADLLQQEFSEDQEAEDLYSYYSDEEGVYLQEGEQAASSSNAQASSWVAEPAEPAQDAYDYYEAYDDYESQVQQEDKSNKRKEEAQSEYTYEEEKSEDEYTYEYEYPSSESEGSESEETTFRRFNKLPKPANCAHRVSLSSDSDSSVAEPRARKKVKKRSAISRATASGKSGAVKEEEPKVKVEVKEEPQTRFVDSDVESVDSPTTLQEIQRKLKKLEDDQEVDDCLRDKLTESRRKRVCRAIECLEEKLIKARRNQIRLARVASRCTQGGQKR